MMLFKKLLRDLNYNKIQFISIFLMSLIGVFVYVGINAEWYGMKIESDKYYNETVLGDIWVIGSNFSKETEDKISTLKSVTNTERRLTIESNAKVNGNPTIKTNFVEKNEISKSLILEGEEFDVNKEGVWVEEAFAKSNNLGIGDTLTLEFNGASITQEIKGLIMNPEYVYAPKDESEITSYHKSHGYAFLSYKSFINPDNIIYNQILVDTNSENYDETENEISEIINDGKTMILNRNSHPSYSMFQNEIEQNKVMGEIFPLVFLIIAVLSIITTMARLTSKQRTQIGILKALGFSNKKIMFHYISYGLFITFFGALIGFILGPMILPNLIYPMQIEMYTLPLWKGSVAVSNIFVVIIGILSSIIVSYFSIKSELKGTPSETLRPKSPKVSKHTKIEKSKLWNNLKFTTQWNLRDITRNKIRTVMGILGVAGCAMLLLSAFGLSNTVSNIGNWMYNELTTYNSKINLEDSVTKDQIEEIKNKYNGQLIEEETVEIEGMSTKKSGKLKVLDEGDFIIFQDVNGNKINLPNGNMKNDTLVNEKLSNNGIAISYKMASLLNIKVGDEIKWHIYGDDRIMSSKVKVIYRTPLDQGIVMSKENFESLNFEFDPTSILTGEIIDTNIKSNGISDVQSKDELRTSFNKLLESMNMIIGIMMLGAVVLGSVVLYNLGVLSYMEKTRDMATLKVLGFTSKKIRIILEKQNIWITIIGVTMGIPLGLSLISYMLTTMGDTIDMRITVRLFSYIISILGTFILSILINFILSRSVKTINMVESLKGVE